ncbi:hypothetical protein CVT30_46265 [Streptomyces sp. AMCC400023]|nr:hypothetical protein CVT30_46265 [Streptomyces sp. AMCC400023]
MVEDDGDGQAQSGGGGQPVAEVDGGEGVEAEVLERPARLDGVGVRVSECRGGGVADEAQQGAGAFGLGERGEAGPQ